ncbi:peptidase M23 [Roseobacter denitrificans]|uniref:Peptidase, M23/M37 family, putative n=1 Tax=Roseobacter denitrificans (strain ATCC 33942 / OCh 114) TaxID=375451 RepID=Q164S2_ROSDO|nr:M23 family metallopeptidase [Roseobacter denitrificans]ABG32521.1 peptidase, M23/M37 family, putative [Roseobacter denitrificans OCh 114]AVL51970.1 peptidase M23 [Roseobacter denitrificans]SFF82998.1 Murein DD-endopeptidase MepM and murein hydrolase activator NlpD, contain LysM domain [Roseobacter denitrificans OCh 114]
MRTRLGISIHNFLERLFPERRVFLKSDTDTRFIRLRPGTQLIAVGGVAIVVGWSIVVTSMLFMNSIGAGNFREQAKRDQTTYQARLNDLAEQRDRRAAEALAAQQRFNAALEQISTMQSELLRSETRRHELETGIEVIQGNLRRAIGEREAARTELAALKDLGTQGSDKGTMMAQIGETAPVDILADALARTAQERDEVVEDAQDALEQADRLALEIALMKEDNDQIFRQLEEAMTISVAPLDKMFREAGLPTERILDQIRRGYSGQGGPLTPLSFSSRGEEPSADMERANRLLGHMDTLNLYRIAAEKAPFALPVKQAFRFTSDYGYRRDPKTGGRRMHKGVDFAASLGTDLHATADGVVTEAGWSSGYGRLIKIQHEFGIETRYAHLSKIRVKVGQRVSRGDHIGDMGASGRVTGVHLHYEVRVGGKAVNPMIFIKAAQDVF